MAAGLLGKARFCVWRVFNGHTSTSFFSSVAGVDSFSSLGLHRALVDRLRLMDIVKPMEVQAKGIRPVLEGRHAVINAETGSGKTLCYLLPVMHKILTSQAEQEPPLAVILVPSNELGKQVASVFQDLAAPELSACLVHGRSKLQILPELPVVISTPNALLEYKLELLEKAKMIVVDEADMLVSGGGKGFWDVLEYFRTSSTQDVREIAKQGGGELSAGVTPRNARRSKAHKHMNMSMLGRYDRQFVFVAATLPSKGKKSPLMMIKNWISNDAEWIDTEMVHQKVSTLKSFYLKVTEQEKAAQLLVCVNTLAGLTAQGRDEHKIVDKETQSKKPKFLVFANSKGGAIAAYNFLTEDNKEKLLEKHRQSENIANYKQGSEAEVLETAEHDLSMLTPEDVSAWKHWQGRCGILHKNIEVEERLDTLQKFRDGDIDILISTDIASRGLDIPDITAVIQYDFASNAANSLHRAGRTARAGAAGKVINFVTEKDYDLACAVKACEDGAVEEGFEQTFSRNRMFRRRMKQKQIPLSQI